MWTPLLSEEDPAELAEGSIDPLGTDAIAEVLAVQLVPGVRERQKHPRFLTAMAVSFSICDRFSPDEVAVDRISEPWTVFEWYVVEGLYRSCRQSDELDALRGLPGRDKAAKAFEQRIPLSAKRYLKSPNIFGFHAVYRALARDLKVQVGDRLGVAGYDLLEVWESEQGLSGIRGSGVGPGKAIRSQLVEAVREGLKSGCVARTNWNRWEFFRDHLRRDRIGIREAELIHNGLKDPNAGHRREVLEFLIGDGRKVWSTDDESGGSERRFHAALSASGDSKLNELLGAISAYEHFSRLLQDAFDDIRFETSTGAVSPTGLANLAGVRTAVEQVSERFAEVSAKLAPVGQSSRFQRAFAGVSEKCDPSEFVERLLQHHRDVQKNKPPAGKASWFDSIRGAFQVRINYRRDTAARHDDAYVHAYRTNSLWSFAHDLRLVPHAA